ncbi:MAG: gamma-glutamyltransferase [Planctomycetes bacterium]|nr:gamma-glutamyltransferase [Planctomycetota bacterium]
MKGIFIVMSLICGSSILLAEGPSTVRGRSMVIARRGVVATSQPLAVQAGIDMLKAGGNAFDAAVAAAAVLNVVEPMSTGVGGDVFAIAWVAREKKLVGLNGSGRSSRHATLEKFRAKGYAQVPLFGPDSVTVPGAFHGWASLIEKYGKLPLAKTLAPAIHYAREGFPVSEIIAGNWRGAEALKGDPDFASTYLIQEGERYRTPRVGEVFREPHLARTFEILAEKGIEAFYRGEIAARIAACLERRGSLIDAEDLARHASTWVEPISTTFHGYQVFELPPNGQGLAVLEMLNLLEGYDLKSLGHNSAAYLHLFLEAKKFAWADRDRFIADPTFGQLPVERLLSKEYAARVRAKIDPRHASVRPRSVLEAGSDTVYLAAADGEGNMVSFINSLFHGFGSRLVVPETGICLQNRGALYSLDPNHLNRLEPSKRPFHTIIPGFVLKNGKPYMAFGVMGGDFQPQGHVQVLLNHIVFGMNPQAMGEQPRAAEDGGRVALEEGIGAEARRQLEALGHQVTAAGGFHGGYQAILIDTETGVYHAGSDPRKDGCAAGF